MNLISTDASARFSRLALAALVCCGLPLQAQEAAPLSAIDWLDTLPAAEARPVVQTDEPPVADTGVVPEVTSTPLGAVSSAGAGLLPSSVTGLPETIWASSRDTDLAAQIEALPDILLPAQQELRYRLLLATAAPPIQNGEDPLFLRARVAALVRLGAVEQALALLNEAGPDTRYLFDQWFSVSLLTGTEDAACSALAAQTTLTDDLPARIFCLARDGNWDAAALTLQTGRALGDLPDDQVTLLTWFLDPAFAEDQDPLPLSGAVDPLEFRLREAVGFALGTTNLPRAFAAADLMSSSGWKAQLEAAERLSQTGALPANQLFGIYTERQPSASGGIWNRVEAIQRLDIALDTRDPTAIAALLPDAWDAVRAVGLGATFAQLLAPRLADLPLPDSAAQSARHILLASDSYEQIADDPAAGPILRAVAAGDVEGVKGSSPLEIAVLEGFAAPQLDDEVSTKLEAGRLGEVILGAMHLAADAQDGDIAAIAAAIGQLRAVGLEDIARRTALNLLLADPG